MNRHTIPPTAGEPSRSGGGDLHHTNNMLAANLRGASSLHTVFLNFFTQNVFALYIKKKKIKMNCKCSSAVKCIFSDALARVRYLNSFSFAGMAFARVIVLNIRKPNGVCCPVPGSLFSEALETRPELCLQCTKPYNPKWSNCRDDERSFANLQSLQPGHRLGSHVIIIYRAS